MLKDQLYYRDSVFRYDSLIFYRNIREDGVLKQLIMLCDGLANNADPASLLPTYYEFVSKLVYKAETRGFAGNILKKYMIYLFLNDENIFSLACENNKKLTKTGMLDLALKDVKVLEFFMNFELENLCQNLGFNESLTQYTPVTPVEYPYIDQIEFSGTAEKMLSQLLWHYGKMGCGQMGNYKFFRTTENKTLKLNGIKNYDSVSFSDIIGYDFQKEAIRSNTEAFLNGSPANNMLLVGSRGTGKSSCVKALANEYFERGLRILEITKGQIDYIPGLMDALAKRGKFFILFIDDLSYDDFEIQYKYLKSVLEGSVEMRPKNVLFYATSNRRHIVMEKWSDKVDHIESDEIHTTDTVNEKLSLSDRFGVTVTFSKPTPADYLNIVMGIAKKEKLNVPEEFLKEQAMNWELNQKGLSGRTARQFINNILCELNKK